MLTHKPLIAYIALLVAILVAQSLSFAQAPSFVQKYCLDCHDAKSKEGGLDLEAFLSSDPFDATLVFENIITHRMPPADADQPTVAERQVILSWLAQ
ncbi:MAG: c-type cytochrome domain-containing protein, partial [Pirellula sp.]